MSLTLEQIANRKNGIGASEAAIVLGLDTNVSPYQLWLDKTGRQPRQDISDLPHVYWGTLLEPLICEEYARRHSVSIQRSEQTWVHPEHTFMLCHLDGKIFGEPRHIECKFAMFARDEWGPTGSDIIPLKYIVQVQHQLAVTGHTEADLVVLIGGYDYREYYFKADPALITKIIDELGKFWECVQTDTPPEARDRSDVALMYPRSNGNYIEADMNVITQLQALQTADLCKREVIKESDAIKDSIIKYIGEHDGIKNGEQVLCTWLANKNGVRTFRPKGEV